MESSPIELIKSPMWFGKEKASINITTIISPSCQHCRKVVFELLTLIEKGIDFRWNIMLGKIMNEDSQKIEMWVQEYISDKNKFLKSLHLWSNERTRCLHYSLNSVNQDIRVSEICYDFEYKMKKLNVLGFPQIVLNDRLLSTIYTAKDLEFIIADLSQ
ncbi:MAG: DsbA family protein [Phocaeicola sp.]|nr:DsbA family protein [Phocaeicola sp.]